MILSTRETLVVVRNQNMTELDEHRAHGEPGAHPHSCLIAEERERSECSIGLPVD